MALATLAGETPEDVGTKKFTAIISPEGVAMLSLAGILDIIGIICCIFDIFFGVGEIPSWISDGVGIIFISSWMWFRSGRVVIPERAKERADRGLTRVLRKLFRGKFKKFLTPIIGEVAPVVGVLPFWTLCVYYELTS